MAKLELIRSISSYRLKINDTCQYIPLTQTGPHVLRAAETAAPQLHYVTTPPQPVVRDCLFEYVTVRDL